MSEDKKVVMKFSDEQLDNLAPIVAAMVDSSRDVRSFAISELQELGFEPQEVVPEAIADMPIDEPIIEEEMIEEEAEEVVRSDEEIKADLQVIIDNEDTDKKTSKDSQEHIDRLDELNDEKSQAVKNSEDFLAENKIEVEEPEVEVTEEITVEEVPAVI